MNLQTSWLAIGAAALMGMVASFAATGLLVPLLRAGAVVDTPNERSSHTVPTPRGGGLGILASVLPSWFAVALWRDDLASSGLMLLGAAIVAIVSWRDDLVSLPPLPRFGTQAAAVAIGILALPADGFVFQGVVPPALDRLLAGLAWLWFLNLFNFMDGINGLAGSETIAICVGAIFVASAVAPQGFPILETAILAGAAAGFLYWNWTPARVFLGDVGSATLGFLLGWLLLNLCVAGHLAAALLLPLYFTADATFTLVRRMLRRERFWEAHREHFYQRAVAQGRSHGSVVHLVAVTNAVLIALALASVERPWLALLIGLVVTAGLLLKLTRSSRP